MSPYAASKKGAEALCWTYHHLYGLDVTVFRYFTYVDDVAKGTILGLRPLGHELINLGGESPHDLLEVG